jgi:predicted dehydrogenase
LLRIGIVGCGRIADQHAIEIQKISRCKIVGVCDKEWLMAKQMSERFSVEKYVTDIRELLEMAKPDVVHITTPPQSHFELGKICLQAGCSVFMEKPFALNRAEAETLIEKAQQNQQKITVGHNVQFSHAAMRMRELVRSGYLGGDPVHMESIWCYSFLNPGYAKAILGDENHWIRSLPGRYLQDILSHGISRIAEFLKNDNPEVYASGFVSPILRSMNENDIVDELRVMIYDNGNTTAYYTFSSQISPPMKEFRIHGPKNSIIVDHEHQTVLKISKNYKYYLNHFIPPLIEAKENIASSMRNMKKFLKRDFHFESGRRFLIQSFYESVAQGKPVPIPYREILLTAKIMDDIFAQIY